MCEKDITAESLFRWHGACGADPLESMVDDRRERRAATHFGPSTRANELTRVDLRGAAELRTMS